MKLLNQNGKYRIISEFEIVEKLPANYFQLDWDDLGNIFLTESNKLMLPEKIYDFSSQNRKLIINSFLMGNKNMGVLLSGEKGTGKSIDAKLFCEEIDAPKILITKPIPKKIDFVQFLNNIKQSYVLFVDEFEKSFKINEFEDEEQSVHEQNSFLQLLDGLNNEFKKFFLFAANLRVSEYLINRPSRIKYLIRYKGIKEENAIFVINELLHDKSLTEDLLKNLDLHSLTIDILVSIIGEININKTPYSSFKDIFNYSSHESSFIIYQKRNETDDYTIIENQEIEINHLANRYLEIDGISFNKVSQPGKKPYLYRNAHDSKHMLKVEFYRSHINMNN